MCLSNIDVKLLTENACEFFFFQFKLRLDIKNITYYVTSYFKSAYGYVIILDMRLVVKAAGLVKTGP